MMNRKQYLLMKLAEECCEAAQRALKQAQFGGDEIEPGKDQSNSERLLAEVVDVFASIAMLQEEGALRNPDREELIRRTAAKAERVEKWYAHSKSLGLVTE